MPFSNFKKKNSSLASLSPASRFNFFFFLGVLLLLLQSSSIICFFNLLLVRRRDSIFFTALGVSASWRFNSFIVLRISSSRFCVGLWVWFFFAFLLHLRHSASSLRYVSPSRCFFFLHCCRRWRKPPLGS